MFYVLMFTTGSIICFALAWLSGELACQAGAEYERRRRWKRLKR